MESFDFGIFSSIPFDKALLNILMLLHDVELEKMVDVYLVKGLLPYSFEQPLSFLLIFQHSNVIEKVSFQ